MNMCCSKLCTQHPKDNTSTPVSTHRPQERLLHLLGEEMEHVHGFGGQGKIRTGNTLILSELRLPGLLLILGNKQLPKKPQYQGLCATLPSVKETTPAYSSQVTGQRTWKER